MCFLMCWDCIYIFGVNLNENENNVNTRENAALDLIIRIWSKIQEMFFNPTYSWFIRKRSCEILGQLLEFPMLFSEECIRSYNVTFVYWKKKIGRNHHQQKTTDILLILTKILVIPLDLITDQKEVETNYST